MEKDLTVKNVSKILGTNPETIRRWLRAGVLTAYPKVGEKSASVIDPKSFESLVKKMPKYGPALLGLGLIAGPIGAMAITLLGASEVIRNGILNDEKENINNVIISQIKKKQTEKKLKENEIERIKVEIKDIDNEIDQLNKMFASIVDKTKTSC